MTLIVPKATAMTSRTFSSTPLDSAMSSSPPSTTMPWMALVPDINGVCSVLGTFEMTANPTKPASTSTAMSMTRLSMGVRSLLALSGRGRLGAVVNDLAATRDARAGDDLIFEVQR